MAPHTAATVFRLLALPAAAPGSALRLPDLGICLPPASIGRAQRSALAVRSRPLLGSPPVAILFGLIVIRGLRANVLASRLSAALTAGHVGLRVPGLGTSAPRPFGGSRLNLIDGGSTFVRSSKKTKVCVCVCP